MGVAVIREPAERPFMSDLSQPPLTLLPTEGEAGFAWPTPDLSAYPRPAATPVALGCQIEGLNGRTLAGRLLAFDPQREKMRVQLAGSRGPMTLRFGQFRRLRLLDPLLAIQASDGTPHDLQAMAGSPFRLTMREGPVWEGTTLDPVEDTAGLYFFEPLAPDGDGTLRRTFVPRSAYDRLELGMRIGEALIDQHSATPQQVEQALLEQERLRQQKLGEVLLLQNIISPDELALALERQSSMPMVRIGEALTALGFITEAQLQEALVQQRSDRSVPLGELLVRQGLVSRADLQTALSRKMGYPLVDVGGFPVEPDAVARIPLAVASRLPALPLMLRGGRLVVALEDPSNRRALDELEFAAQCKVLPALARAGTLDSAVARAYEGRTDANPGGGAVVGGAMQDRDTENATKLLAELEQSDTNFEEDELGAVSQSDNQLVRLINSMILEAQSQGVSDIHVECLPGREKIRIRFRRDGQMRAYMELPPTYRSALIARIKIMCDLDIAERRKPQDGKINFAKFVAGSKLELRVATIPTSGGVEDAVLRLLASSKPIPLDNLGLSPRNLEQIKTGMQRPHGMLLCVGPTGSGKTTTLHSAISTINTPERKIWTAEDPVEITQAGLRQVQVNPKIEWTFAKALRAFLRADPDVIMVGEIRDAETAQCAVEASLTGHLVLSTLHTNSAPETVTRLLDMGMDPFNFADALLGVLAQRLVRRLCTHCRIGELASAEDEEELVHDFLHVYENEDVKAAGVQAPDADALLAEWRVRFGSGGHITRYRPMGCPRCDGTGFRGRAGIHELMMATRGLRHLVQTSASAAALQCRALQEGMRTLRQDGIEKVLAGVTTIKEVRANS
jgi:type II secretory ATPase GspE/PulE/Tfp pilus assembly ATPase PilB-like protein